MREVIIKLFGKYKSFRIAEGKSGGAQDVPFDQFQRSDFSDHRVFTCKMSKFLENIVDRIDGDPDSNAKVGDEHYGNTQFERTCRSSDFDADLSNKIEAEASEASEDDSENNAVVIEANNADNADNTDNKITPKDKEGGMDSEDSSDSKGPNKTELPVLIFEGLPEPRTKGFRTEERLIESILNETMGIPESSVRRAFRLPVNSNGKSLVMVEMDTIENEEKVLKKESKLKRTKEHVEIRTAHYKDLWRLVERLSESKSSNQVSDSDSDFSHELQVGVISAKQNETIEDLPEYADYDIETETESNSEV